MRLLHFVLFKIYFPYSANELRYRENTVIFGLRDFSRESTIVSQRFAGCSNLKRNAAIALALKEEQTVNK